MANVYELLNQIEHAILGADVRDSIHDAIEQCYDDATGSPSSVAALVQKFIGTGTIVSGSHSQTIELSSTPTELCSIELEAGTWMLISDYDSSIAVRDNAGAATYGILVRAGVTNTNTFIKSIYPPETGSIYDSGNFTCIIDIRNDSTIKLIGQQNNTNGYVNIYNITMKAIQISGDSSETPVVDNKELAVDSNDYLYLT